MNRSKRHVYILTTLVISFAWIGAAFVINLLSLYGLNSLSVKLPFGWTESNYPLNCRELENMRYYDGQKYIVEPGFLFKFSKETDDALDSLTIADYCGGTTIISSSNFALVLDAILISAPTLVSMSVFVFIIVLEEREVAHKA